MNQRKGVIGVIFDEYVIFNSDEETGIKHLCNGVDHLFRKLIFSNILCGISSTTPFANDKSDLLKQSGIHQSYEYFLFDSSFLNTSLQNISESWGSAGGVILFVASASSRGIFQEIHSYGWEIAVVLSTAVGSGGNYEKNDDLSVFYMKELDELPLTVCRLNKESVGDDDVTVVGYIMKQVREEEFSKRGALPMCPNESGLIFMPLKFNISMDLQLNEVDVVLHKATDEILSIEQNCSFDLGQGIVYTSLMHRFEIEMKNRPNCCVIDRLENIMPVLDRRMIQNMLHGLDSIVSTNGSVIRPPRFLEISCFADLDSISRCLSDIGLVYPLIVKPRIACGLSEAHSMAIVFGLNDFIDLGVPLPAIVQEYVQHSAKMFKIYVLGDNVYNVAKNSTPNTSTLTKMYEINGYRPLLFDSLRCLPLEKDGVGNAYSGTRFLDIDLVTNVAKYLSKKLDLTIFGFDLVVEDRAGDHVIVDINYFPSFNEVPNDVGIPAFWDAIKHRFQKHLRNGGDLWRQKV